MILDIKKITQSKVLIIVALIAGFIAILAFVFQVGVFVGFHKASFLFKNGDNFYKAYGNRDNRMMGGMGMLKDELSGGHGAIGKIVKIELPNLVVLGPDNIEKIIITSTTTSVREARNEKSIGDLSLDNFITVLGTPNEQGQIVAKFIRILPAPGSNPENAMNNKKGSR